MNKLDIIKIIFKGIITLVLWLVLMFISYVIMEPVWEYDYPFGGNLLKYPIYSFGLLVFGYVSALLMIKLVYNED